MRITPDILNKIARDTVSFRTRNDRDILAVYLLGSLLTEEPLLGGTTDIDLFFIHHEEVKQGREIVRLTDEVHLDIAHHNRTLYHQTRDLRLHPWMGPNIFQCKILYDPQHFMDFTQASVRGQFHQPENIYSRVQVQTEHARQTWLSFQLELPQAGLREINLYLEAIENAANALASLGGDPLTERRFILAFEERVKTLGLAGMEKGLLGLLGAPQVEAAVVEQWLPLWKAALDHIPPDQTPEKLHPYRRAYYLRAFDAMLAGSQPLAVLWPLLKTWNRAIAELPENSAQYQAWEGAVGVLGLSGSGFTDRLAALDAFLDTVEEAIEKWAQKNGVL